MTGVQDLSTNAATEILQLPYTFERDETVLDGTVVLSRLTSRAVRNASDSVNCLPKRSRASTAYNGNRVGEMLRTPMSG